MNTLVIEHVAMSELPDSWRERLRSLNLQRVTVRIEPELDDLAPSAASAASLNPLFGIWQDRVELADPAEFARKLREPRYDTTGLGHE